MLLTLPNDSRRRPDTTLLLHFKFEFTAEDSWPGLEEAGQTTGALIPLPSLQGEWKQLSDDAMPIAYLEAQSATQHLLDRYSMYGVRQVINGLAAGQSLDAAMQQKLSVSYEQFQRQWEQTYHASIKPLS